MTTYVIDAGRSKVHVAAKSTLHGIDGHADGLRGTIELDADGGLVAAHLEVEAEQLRWGNPLLDRETRRRIDVRSHPTIVGDVLSSELAHDGTFHLRGTIGFRGLAHEVAGDVVVTTPEAGRLVVDGDQSFDVRDWGLEPPRLLLISVDPVIRVRMHVEADRS